MDRFSQAAPNLPGRHEVHLWLAPEPAVYEPHLQVQHERWLSDEERTRWRRFHFAADRDRYLLARGLVRGTLTRYLPRVTEAAWRFVPNEHGRPFLAPDQQRFLPLHFNLSHTRGLVALAIARSKEVGLDVESLTRAGAYLSVADRFFAPAETLALRQLSGVDAHQRRFLELWTLKESYIKARGMGLALALDSFAFSFHGPGKLQLRTWPAAGDSAAGWAFALCEVNRAHRLALALREGPGQSRLDIRVATSGGRELALDLRRQSCPAVRLGPLPGA